MIPLLAVSLLPPVLLGYLIVRVFMPLYRPAAAAQLLYISLGAGLGAGVLSLLFFLVRLLFGTSNLVYSGAEILVLAAAAAGYWFFRDRSVSGAASPRLRGWLWLLPVATIVCLAIAAAVFLDTSAAGPYGNWDAWSLWNLRAKLLSQSDAGWKNAFSPLLNQLAGRGATHGDYPLLLSGYIARCWSLTGTTGDVTAPIAVAGLFSLATVGLLVAGLAVLRGWTAAPWRARRDGYGGIPVEQHLAACRRAARFLLPRRVRSFLSLRFRPRIRTHGSPGGAGARVRGVDQG
jgi:hypothetical protein